MKSVTVTIPVPHRSLSPNARAYWAVKAKHKQNARHTAQILTLKETKCSIHNWPTASVAVVWFARTASGLRMDHDNIIGSLKGTIDGIADAGLLADDRGVTWLPPRVEVDKLNPRIEITITKTGD